MIDALAFVVVVLTGIYLFVLAAISLCFPRQATRFLHGFARSPRVHYIEMFLRLMAGGAMVVYAPNMFASAAFSVFGWVLLVTATGLLILPWRWHHRFAQNVVPRATRRIKIVGLCSLALGVLILAAVFH